MNHLLFCVDMRRADHLWEVDDNRFTGLAFYEDIEFVEVAVDESGVCEAHNKVHEL